jgi:dihydroxy-acid dehydratase
MAKTKLTPDKILTAKSFENALRVLLAIGGSTNGVIHLTAIAGAWASDRPRARWTRSGARRRCSWTSSPRASTTWRTCTARAACPTLLRELKPCCTSTRSPSPAARWARRSTHSRRSAQDVVRPMSNPLYPQGGIAVLRGNLAPAARSSSSPPPTRSSCRHEGRAVVFENARTSRGAWTADDLDVKAEDILVLKNIGPEGRARHARGRVTCRSRRSSRVPA